MTEPVQIPDPSGEPWRPKVRVLEAPGICRKCLTERHAILLGHWLLVFCEHSMTGALAPLYGEVHERYWHAIGPCAQEDWAAWVNQAISTILIHKLGLTDEQVDELCPGRNFLTVSRSNVS